jgi:acyl-coenzyme A synthetase/AMP-(fatty) acid ligase
MNELVIPEVFNATTAFVDANIEAGHGAKTAFFCGEQQISYDDVWEGVNRTGNALRELGVELEQRVAPCC